MAGTDVALAIPYNDLEKMAAAIAKSQLFGVKTPEQALALMLVAQSEGLHPAIAARDYHVIQGRPALKADAMLARFQQAGGKVDWKSLSDTKAEAVFSHAQGGSAPIDWDIERAKKAGLSTKDMWVKYPRQMLRARVISEGVRTVFPGCISGFYTPEEVQDGGPAEEIVVGSGSAADSATVAADDKATEKKPARKRGVDAMKDKLDGKTAPADAEEVKTNDSAKPKITPAQVTHIAQLLVDFNIDGARLLKAAKVETLMEILAENYDRTVEWLNKAAAAKAAAEAAEKLADGLEL